MPDTSVYQLPGYPTYEEVLDRERERERNAPGLIGTLSAAADLEWIPFFLADEGRSAQYEDDPEFQIDDELWKQLTNGVDPAYYRKIASARSLEHAWHLKAVAQRRTNSARMLQDVGWAALPARMVVGALDPVEFTLDAATAGATSYLTAGRALSRAARGAITGALTAAEVGVLEGTRAAFDPTRTALDVGGAMAASFALSGALGAWISPKAAADLDDYNVRTSAMLDDISNSADSVPVAPRVVPSLEERASAVNRKLRADMNDAAPFIVDDPAAFPVGQRVLDASDTPYFWGGMDRENANALLSATIIGDLDAASDAPGGAKWVRFGMSGKTLQDADPNVRRLSRMMMQDAVPIPGDGKAVMAATEGKDLLMRQTVTDMTFSLNAPFEQFVKDRGYGWTRRNIAWEAFGDEIGRAVRRTNTNDASWLAAGADQIRATLRHARDVAKRVGVPGADRAIADADKYLPRIVLPSAFADNIGKYGNEAVERVWSEALNRGMPTITPEQALRFARAYEKRARRAPFHVDIDFHRMIDSAEGDDLATYLADFLGIDAKDGELSDILARITADRAEKRTDTRFKHRLPLDENHSIEVVNKATGQTETLAIADFLDNNGPRVALQYANRMYGLAYETQILKSMTPAGREAFPSWDALVKWMKDDASQRLDAFSPEHKRFMKNMDRLDLVHRAILGLPMHGEGPVSRKVLKLLKNWNIMRSGGMLGAANAPEIGRVQAELGTNIMLRSMPAFSDIVGKAKGGYMPDGLIGEIQRMSAPEIDSISRMSMRNRYVDVSGMSTPFDTAMDLSDRGAALTMSLSGFNTVNRTERLCAASGFWESWLRDAQSGSLPDAKRLAAIGLDENMARRIHKQINAWKTEWTGDVGKKSHLLNVTQWNDAEAAAHFLIAGDKWLNRVVQQNDIGQLSMWMTTPLAKALLQWRNFTIASFEKKLLFDVMMHDKTAAAAWMGELFMGGLAATAIVYLKSLGREDAEEYRAKLLTPEGIARGAFRRAGFAATMTGPLDTAMVMIGEPKLFDNYATTDPVAGLLTESPLIDLATTAWRAGQGTLSASVNPDVQYTRGTLRDTMRLLPWNNVAGVQNVLNWLSSRYDLPYNSAVPGTEQDNGR